MTTRKPVPGVSRKERTPNKSLRRLERQLKAGTISKPVLEQWLRRYGRAAKELIDTYWR